MIPKPERRTLGLLGTLLVRGVVPLWVLSGAIIKLATATPRDLPSWMIDLAYRIDPINDPMPLVLQGIIAAELIAVGVMLFAGRWARAAAIVILGAFCFVLIAEIAHQGESCGCFGATLQVNPWVMLAIDGTLFALALVMKPMVREPHARMPSISVAGLAVWIIAGLTLSLLGPFATPPRGQVSEQYMWRPMGWIGKDFLETPLAELGIDPELYGGGDQTWVFYRKTCPTCHHLFEERFQDRLEQLVLAIHVPPQPGDIVDEDAEDVICPDCEFWELPTDRDWPLIRTPLIVYISADGTIAQVEDPLLQGTTLSGDDS